MRHPAFHRREAQFVVTLNIWHVWRGERKTAAFARATAPPAFGAGAPELRASVAGRSALAAGPRAVLACDHSAAGRTRVRRSGCPRRLLRRRSRSRQDRSPPLGPSSAWRGGRGEGVQAALGRRPCCRGVPRMAAVSLPAFPPAHPDVPRSFRHGTMPLLPRGRPLRDRSAVHRPSGTPPGCPVDPGGVPDSPSAPAIPAGRPVLEPGRPRRCNRCLGASSPHRRRRSL
jgi:hypothetical protein